MNIKDFNKGNTETVNFLESATELKKLKRYYDAEHVKRYIGAAIHSSYSIGYLNGDTFIAIDPNKTVFSSEDDIELYVFGNANINEELDGDDDDGDGDGDDDGMMMMV